MVPRAPQPADSVTLLRRAQDGDRSAYEGLFARYYSRVHRIVRARMGERLRRYDDPEDLVQNTFIQAIHSFDSFEVREDARLIDWFAKLVEHQVLKSDRHHGALKRDRERDVVLRDVRDRIASGEIELEPVRSDTAIVDRVANEEHKRILDECLAELPEQQREVILLRDYAQGSWDWIARELDRPSVAAAREFHRRALLRLMETARPRLGL